MSYPNLKQMHRNGYKNKYHFKCNTILYRSQLMYSINKCTRPFLSSKGIMILKENLIEWKVSCLRLFTECLTQSPGSYICCGKEWVRGKVSMWMADGVESGEERREMWCVWGIGKQYSVNKRPARNTQTRPQEPSIMVIWWEHTGMINMQRVCSVLFHHHQVTRTESKLWIQSIPEKLSTLCPSHVIQSEWSESLMSILNYKRLCLCASLILSTI